MLLLLMTELNRIFSVGYFALPGNHAGLVATEVQGQCLSILYATLHKGKAITVPVKVAVVVGRVEGDGDEED